jgi:hypothetical protein
LHRLLGIMKNPSSICSLFILVFIFAFVASCTKSSQPATPYSNIYGKWKIVQEATDDTNTGRLDSNQVRDLASNDIESISFNKDSTGTHYITYDGAKNDFNFRWSLINSFSDIRMITTGGDTLTAKILSNYGSMLTLKNYTTPQISWYILKKQ